MGLDIPTGSCAANGCLLTSSKIRPVCARTAEVQSSFLGIETYILCGVNRIGIEIQKAIEKNLVLILEKGCNDCWFVSQHQTTLADWGVQ